MKNIKEYLIVAIVILSIASSCYKDKGNYVYDKLSIFEVDTLSVQKEFIVSQFDTLHLKPKLTYNGNISDLEFTWSAYLFDKPLNGSRSDTLSQNQFFDLPIGLFPEKYYLEYSIREKATGRKSVWRYVMHVEGLGSGLMVLYSKNRKVDIDLIKPRFLDGLLTNDQVKRNIYSIANPDHPLEGEAIGVGTLKTGDQQWINVLSDRDAVKVSPADMAIQKPFSQLFALAPNIAKPEFVSCPTGVTVPGNVESSDGMEFMVNDGKAYANMVLFAFGKPSAYSILLAADGDYQAAPFVRYGLARILVFDQSKGRFLGTGPLSTSLTPVLNTGTAFDFQNIQGDLLYLDYAYGGQYMNYGIFADKADKARKFLYVMDFASSQALHKWDLTGFQGIANSNYFAYATRTPIVYYADKSIIYRLQYDWNAGSVSRGSIAWSGLPAAEEITGIKFCPHPGRNLSESAKEKYLFVSTYNSNTQEGKIYVLSVNLSSGALGTTPIATYSGFGKIKDIAFKF